MPEFPDIPFIGPPKHFRAGRPGKPKWIVIHNTSNDNLASAEDEAKYAKRRTDIVSSHYYCDRRKIVQSLSTSDTAWHAGANPGNPFGIAYEITGQNGLPREWWLANVAWVVLARQIARDCRRNDIPARWVTIEQMRDGVRGLTTHNDCRLAWGGTTHTDPGPGFPRDHLLRLVQAELGGAAPAPRDPLGEDDDMTPEQANQLKELHLLATEGKRLGPSQTSGGGIPIAWWPRQYHTHQAELVALRKVIESMAAAVAAGGGTVDTVAILSGVDERLEVLRKQLDNTQDDVVAGQHG